MLQSLTIFEGPDCSGKSTAAYEFYKEGNHGAMFVHHGPYPQIKRTLPRLYVETMMPMLMGGAPQIWDRCWYSEPIYGAAFRHGENRIGRINQRHLERFALRHGGVVVLCLPDWDTVSTKWLERKGEEYLEKEEQLYKVYQDYTDLRRWCGLPIVMYDYTRHSMESLKEVVSISRKRNGIYQGEGRYVGGSPHARCVIVGDKPSDIKDADCIFRLPFSSFETGGSSAWLTSKLIDLGVREDQLMWVNADDQLGWLADRHNEMVIALGKEASKRLREYKIQHIEVEHPSYWKRFRENDESAVYELFSILEGLNP